MVMTDSLEGVTIAFDLDGTLVDTAPDLIAAVNFVLADLGHDAVDPALIRPDISHGAVRMLSTALTLRGSPLSEHRILQLFDDLYMPRYAATIADNSRPFPGLVDALDVLDAAGARAVVCTNKREGLSRKLLTELGLIGRFQAIAGRDTFAVYKPHPDHLTRVIESYGGDPARAVMIGDSDTDIQTARSAGVPVVGVTFGYTSTPMSELGADAVISHFDELVAAIKRVLRHPVGAVAKNDVPSGSADW